MAHETFRILTSILSLDTFSTRDVADIAQVDLDIAAATIERLRHQLDSVENRSKVREGERENIMAQITEYRRQFEPKEDCVATDAGATPEVLWVNEFLMDSDFPRLSGAVRRNRIARAKLLCPELASDCALGTEDSAPEVRLARALVALAEAELEHDKIDLGTQNPSAAAVNSAITTARRQLAIGADQLLRRLEASPLRVAESKIQSLPTLNTLCRIAPLVASNGQIALEPTFARYVQLWVESPTLDATANGLHCLRVLGKAVFRPFLNKHRHKIAEFLGLCVGDHGIGISPNHAIAPTLYAALSAVGVIKALLNLPQHTPLCQAESDIKQSGYWHLYTALRHRMSEFATACVRDGVFVDSPVETEATVHSTDLGISLLWNLGIKPELLHVTASAATDLLSQSSRRFTNEGMGFCSSTNPSLASLPCTGTTALALRIFSRAEWNFPFDRFPSNEIRLFLDRMVVRGVMVFPGQPETISATHYYVAAMRALSPEPDGNMPRRAERGLLSYVRACEAPSGGYAFCRSDGFSPNLHCTRYALRVLRWLDPKPLADTRDMVMRTAKYVSSTFDEESGGFWGYSPDAQSISNHEAKLAVAC